MNITAIGSTLKKAIFSTYRVLRTDDEGRLEIVTPTGSPADVNVAEVGGTTVPSAGLNGVLPIGGTEADAAVPLASFSVRVASIVRGVLTPLTAPNKQTLLTDLWGLLWTHPDCDWAPFPDGSERVNIAAAVNRNVVPLVNGQEYHLLSTVVCWIGYGDGTVTPTVGGSYRLIPDTYFPYRCRAGGEYIGVVRETTDAANGLSICRVR